MTLACWKRPLAEQRLTTAHSLQADVQGRYKAGELSRIDANLAQMKTHTAAIESIGATAPTVINEEIPAARREGCRCITPCRSL